MTKMTCKLSFRKRVNILFTLRLNTISCAQLLTINLAFIALTIWLYNVINKAYIYQQISKNCKSL